MARMEIIGRPDAPETDDSTKVRISQSRRAALSDLAVMQDRIAALKLLRARARRERASGDPRDDARAARGARPMTEYARVRTDDGTSAPRTKAEQSLEKFRRALAARSRPMPPGMVWRESRGFFFPAGMTLAEARERQLQVAREIRWDTIRLGLPPGLAQAAKLDRAMR